jgi:hypothetical protein
MLDKKPPPPQPKLIPFYQPLSALMIFPVNLKTSPRIFPS